MISTGIEEEIRLLRAQQNSYQPTEAVKAELHSKTVVILVGAACEGKSKAMLDTTILDPRLGVAKAFTTREPRPDDGHRYTYYQQTDAGLHPLLERLRTRQVVQYAVNPFGLQIYGTELVDYPYEFNLMDAWSTSVAGLRQLGFGSSCAISIITPPDVWLQRFNDRFPPGHELREARAKEAVQSFTWSLAQPADGQHFWIENKVGHHAAETIIAIVTGISNGDAAARTLCEQSITAATKIVETST